MANKPLLEDSVLIAQRAREVNMTDNSNIETHEPERTPETT